MTPDRSGGRRRPSLLAAGVAVVLLASACSPEVADAPDPGTGPAPVTGTPVPARGGGTLRVGLGAEPASIDPRLVVDAAGEFVARALFEGLVDVGPSGGVSPAGAETWRVADDGLEYRFTLRRATFHDGRPVTAQDHADALLATLDPARPPYGRESILAGLRGAVVMGEDGTPVPGGPEDVVAAGGVEVLGTWGLVLRLVAPDPLLLHTLSDIALAPVPPGADGDPGFVELPVGNGPFRLLEPLGRDGFLRLVAVTDHHRAPRIGELLVQFHPDDVDGERRWADLLAGRLQVTRIPPARREEALRRFGRALPAPPGPTSGLHDAAVAAVYAYAFDTSAPPFDDVRLRQAVAAAIDRTEVAAALGSTAVPATRLLPDVLLADDAAGPPCAHCTADPELARALLAAWAEGRGPDATPPITLTYPRRADHAAVAEVVAAQLEDVLGVRVGLRALDLATLAESVRAGEAPLFRPALRATLGGWAAASSLLDPAFRSTAPRPEAGTGWGDAGTDTLLDRLRAGPDPEAVAALDAALIGEAVVLPLVWLRQDLVVAPEVRGFALDPTGRWWPERVSLR